MRKINLAINIIIIFLLILSISTPLANTLSADNFPPPNNTEDKEDTDADLPADEIPLPPNSYPTNSLVEEGRVREVMEGILRKYLEYLGPRYKANLTDIDIVEQWAIGLVEWQSVDRIGSEEFSIIAHRSLSGDWMAELPNHEGSYLEWARILPDKLINKGYLTRRQLLEVTNFDYLTNKISDSYGQEIQYSEPFTNTIAAELQNTIEDAINQSLILNETVGWTVSTPIYQNNWAYAFFVPIDTRTMTELSTEPRVALARLNENNDWEIALPNTPELFRSWLDEVPVTLIPEDFKEYIRPPETISPNAVDNVTGYRLPYPNDTGANVNKHTDYAAVDFGIWGAGSRGTIRAAKSGTVVFLKDTSTTNCGYPAPSWCTWRYANIIVIRSNDSEYAWYMHLFPNSVPDSIQVGSYVERGTDIGQEGSTGWATGDHLHFMVAPTYGCCNGDGATLAPYWPNATSAVNFDESSWDALPSWAVSQNTSPSTVTCPQSGGVILYKNANYDCAGGAAGTGYVVRPGTGWQNVPSTFNDQASSIKIPSGWSAKLFEHNDRNGASVCRNSDDSNFSGDYFDGGSIQLNDQVSSFEVFDNTNCGSGPTYPATLYEHPNYQGSWCALTAAGWANVYSGFNDVASSIRLQSGWSARVWKHSGMGGTSRCFTTDDSNFSDNTFEDGSPLDNEVSSFAAYNQATCPPLLVPPNPPNLSNPPNGTYYTEGETISLSWSASGDQYYGEFWGGPSGTNWFGWQTGTSKNIGSQWAGYTYSWHIKARNTAGESGWSSTWTFSVRPAIPTNLNGQSTSCTENRLYWTDNSGNEEGYRIYRDGSVIGQVSANVTSYQDPGLSGSSSYSYYVKAFRGSIESLSSNTIHINSPPCTTPKPDLQPYIPPGYAYPVTPASIPGTVVLSTLIAGQATYFDWHFINNGNASAVSQFFVELWVDDNRLIRYPYSNFGAGGTGGFDDWMETITVPGWHTVRIITDPDNTIDESDETNNLWEWQFYWVNAAPYSDNLESGVSEWTTTGLWHLIDDTYPYYQSRSPTHSWWYGQDSTGNYDTGVRNSGSLTSPKVYIPGSGYYLRFWYWYETESQSTYWDQRWLQISVDGGPFNTLLQLYDDPMMFWLQSPVIDLSAYAGHEVQLRFYFFTFDAEQNNYRGWYIDDISITTTPPPTCNDPFEPNNGINQASLISYGQSITADVCPGGDYDYYSFNGILGDHVIIDIDAMEYGSFLDPYIFLIDSDGSTILAENDDEILFFQDSKLGYTLPHDGIYYIKLKAWDHPSTGGTNYYYTINLYTDSIAPIAQIDNPINNEWLDHDAITINVNASDNGSGVKRVEFLWHDSNWDNPDWTWLGSDNDWFDGWSWNFDTSVITEQQGGAFYIWAFDWVGNWVGAGSWNLGIDRTPPTTSFDIYPMYGDAPFIDFRTTWSGYDNLAGVETYDVEVRDRTSSWLPLFTDTTDNYYRFVGEDGHTYYFRVRARDRAGNESSFTTGDGDAQYTVTTCPVVQDSYEADNVFLDASWVFPNGNPQVHNIHTQADIDWFKFTAQEGLTYTLATTNIGGHADTELFLYDYDGNTLISYNDDYPDIYPSSRITWQPPTSGIYYAKVNHWDQWAYGCTTEYGFSITTSQQRLYFPIASYQ